MASKKINAVIFIHGITTEFSPPEPTAKYYKPMWASLGSKIPGFEASRWLPIFVTWGNVFPGDAAPFRPDQRLSLAEQRLSLATTQNVHPLHGSAHWDFGWPIVRQNLVSVRAKLLRGLSDAIYYTSEEGEHHVREVVYGQVLKALMPLLKAGTEVRLHLIAHSLGNAVAHDFLYGIFNTRKITGFAKGQPASSKARKTYLELRNLAKGKHPRVSFGSFSSMASSIPFFVVRKQKIVDLLAKGDGLDPSQIGIQPGKLGLQWKIFYDKDDLLGFPTKNLYHDPGDAIGDYNVSTGGLPTAAHEGYWSTENVKREIALLLDSRKL